MVTSTDGRAYPFTMLLMLEESRVLTFLLVETRKRGKVRACRLKLSALDDSPTTYQRKMCKV